MAETVNRSRVQISITSLDLCVPNISSVRYESYASMAGIQHTVELFSSMVSVQAAQPPGGFIRDASARGPRHGN